MARRLVCRTRALPGSAAKFARSLRRISAAPVMNRNSFSRKPASQTASCKIVSSSPANRAITACGAVCKTSRAASPRAILHRQGVSFRRGVAISHLDEPDARGVGFVRHAICSATRMPLMLRAFEPNQRRFRT